MPSTLLDVFVRSVVRSFDKQLHLADLVGPSDWAFELGVGVLVFGRAHRWRVQVLGTESNGTGTWLWAWANSESEVPDHLLSASRAMRAFGLDHKIRELTEAEVPLDHVDGYTLALIASGVCDSDAFYRCPYEGGALIVLIMDDTFPKCSEPPLQRIATVFPQAIASLDIPDHRQAFIGYLGNYGLSFEQNAAQVVVKENGEAVLAATFGEKNRLAKLNARLTLGSDVNVR